MTLKELLLQKLNGKSQDALAKEIGVSPSTLSRWLSGERNVCYCNMQKLVKAIPEARELFNGS